MPPLDDFYVYYFWDKEMRETHCVVSLFKSPRVGRALCGFWLGHDAPLASKVDISEVCVKCADAHEAFKELLR